jgi:copper chaperone CopZ
MHCGACVKRVSQALEKVEGVQVGEVRVGAARVQTPEDLPETALLSAVEKAGYPAVVER